MATAIRLRQELQKRVTRWAPTPAWTGTRSLSSVLDGSSRTHIANGGSLVTLLRAATAHRFPQMGNLPAGAPPDLDQLLAHAEQLVRGEWRVFDVPLSLHDAAPRWRDHPISGVATPLQHFSGMRYIGEQLGGDVKYIWELNRHSELLRLAQAYWLTRDERFAVLVVALLEDWIASNPPMQGINWVSALEVSFRSIAWCWIWQLTCASPAWNEPVTGRFLWTLSYAARFVDRYDSIHHSPNTHLTGEGLGLLYVGTLFPELRGAARWRRRGIDILVSEIPHQFLGDGFHFERSTGYHRYNVEFYLHALAMARASEEPWAEAVVAPLRQALGVSQQLRLPNGDWPVIGDEDGGATVRLWSSSARSQMPLLTLGAALLNEPGLAVGAEPCDHALAWWFGLSAPEPSPRTAVRSCALDSAGYYLARDETTNVAWYCLVDAGPHGGQLTGHAHTDLGHVELFVGKTPVLCDPGCAVYGSDTARRDWYRSLMAHSCLEIDNNPLATPRGAFGWQDVSPTPITEYRDEDRLWACRSRYRLPGNDGIEHERQVVMVRGHGVVVIDRVTGAGEHDLRWHWPLGLHVDASCYAEVDRTVTIGEVEMTWSGIDSAVFHLANATRSRTYGSEEPCSAIDITARGVTLPVAHVTSFRAVGARSPLVHAVDDDLTIAFADDRVVRSTWGTLPTLDPANLDADGTGLRFAESGDN